MIAAALLLAPLMDGSAIALAWGVFAAGVVQLLFQFPALKKMGLLVAPKPDWKDPGVRQVGKLMVPAIIGSSVAQINLLINTLLASFLVTGSVSWLYYSDRLMEFPLGIFGIALATVILPALADTHQKRGADEFSVLLDWGLRWCFLIGLPASVALILLAEPLVATIFQYGAFTAYDVVMAGQSLVAFSIGLPGLILVKVLAPGFFARQDTRTPAKVAVISVSVNIIMSLLLFKPMAHVGLALAVSIAAYVNCGLLFWYLRRDRVFIPQPGWTSYLAKVLLACAVMGAVLMAGAGDTALWTESSLVYRVTRLTALIMAGIASYFIIVLIMRIPVKAMLTDRRLKNV
jgi:putative peptidoglycan lipid II flippase